MLATITSPYCISFTAPSMYYLRLNIHICTNSIPNLRSISDYMNATIWCKGDYKLKKFGRATIAVSFIDSVSE